MRFSRQEYWNGLSFPFPANLPDLRIEPESPALLADSVPSKPPDETVFNYYSAFFSDLEALDKLYVYR
jgi:hypothetical protein